MDAMPRQLEWQGCSNLMEVYVLPSEAENRGNDDDKSRDDGGKEGHNNG